MAEVCAQAAVEASGDVEVDAGPLHVATVAPGISKHKEAEGTECATSSRATAGAAVVANICLLGSGDVDRRCLR